MKKTFLYSGFPVFLFLNIKFFSLDKHIIMIYHLDRLRKAGVYCEREYRNIEICHAGDACAHAADWLYD